FAQYRDDRLGGDAAGCRACGVFGDDVKHRLDVCGAREGPDLEHDKALDIRDRRLQGGEDEGAIDAVRLIGRERALQDERLNKSGILAQGDDDLLDEADGKPRLRVVDVDRSGVDAGDDIVALVRRFLATGEFCRVFEIGRRELRPGASDV